MRPFLDISHELLHSKKGQGSNYLGWLDYPKNYNRKNLKELKLRQRKFKRIQMYLL